MIYDVAVIGAGPAGCMAAICAAQLGKKVLLIERNDSIGHKLLLTGNGRCNLTNTAELNVFLEKFGRRGSFYRDAFTIFSNYNLMDFFQNQGLELTEDENGRVFPITQNAQSVVDVLKKVLDESDVEVLYNYRLKHVQKVSKVFKISSTRDRFITAHNVILATGGVTYGFTGSTGDGLAVAELLGHHITDIKPGGVPLKVREKWVHDLKGITLKDVGLKIGYGGKILSIERGDLLLTHFGISGPVILDRSNEIVELMDKHGDLKLYIDFKPDLSPEQLKSQLVRDFQTNSKKSIKNYFKYYFPNSAIEPVLEILSINPGKKLNQINRKERLMVQETLKGLPVTINGHIALEKAMVTCGGVSKKEINPKTMESKIISGLYFAGEIISGCGRSGGYNLQQAFSTGYVAGKSASEN
ncbi:MAG: NAD(P)/FAD-dependent oxidoreductase [Methanobacteriaceae archaeon]|nr:NAD(P)/FAD-dependent oxidoreductase [Methanobacteriaceae archaeon]